MAQTAPSSESAHVTEEKRCSVDDIAKIPSSTYQQSLCYNAGQVSLIHKAINREKRTCILVLGWTGKDASQARFRTGQ